MKKGKLIWITGLSGAGKTTIATAVFKKLKEKKANSVFLDGDIIRDVLNNDLSHNPKDRLKNAYRISKLCEFLTSQNIHVVCSTMSLFKEIHQMNRKNIANYYEIFVDVKIISSFSIILLVLFFEYELIDKILKLLYDELIEL